MANAKNFAAILGGFIPSGIIMPFAGTTAPSGWLICDGSPVSRTTYASLFTAISTNFGDGSKFSDGSSSGYSGTHFNLPDFRGRFLRGFDATPIDGKAKASRDPDKTSRTASNTGGNSGDAVGSIQSHDVNNHNHKWGGGNYNWTDNTGGVGVVYHQASNSNGLATTDFGGNETRPINVNVNYIIKY